MSATVQFVTFGPNSIQNFWVEGASLSGVFHAFVPFAYKGASQEAGGENSEAYLAFSNSSMVLAYFNRDAINKTITVRSRWLTSDLVMDTSRTRDETFVINSIAWNEERVEVRLRSPIDAAIARFPNKRLTSGLVGYLPREGSVRIA